MSVITDIKMILDSNNIHLLHDAHSYLEQIERWDAIKNADLVEVVRCKDCVYGEAKDYAPVYCRYYCPLSTNYHSKDFYCSMGEKR